MPRLTLLFFLLTLTGCAASDTNVATDSPRTAATQSNTREFEAEVFAIRPTFKRRQSYQIALRPLQSSDAIIVELWADPDHPFLSEGLGGVAAFQSLPRWKQPHFVVRVEIDTQLSVSRYRLVHWRRVELGA